MKKMKIISIVTVLILFSSTIKAQPRISVNINIGSQPAWGPTGYDHVDYYYLPDIEVYYYVPSNEYFYRSGNTWKHANSLPPTYRNFDFYTAHKVVINNVDKPYLHHNIYQKRYGNYKGKHDQVAIRDSKEEKYFESKSHPQHPQWEKSHPSNNSRNNAGRPNEKDRKDDHTRNDRRN